MKTFIKYKTIGVTLWSIVGILAITFPVYAGFEPAPSSSSDVGTSTNPFMATYYVETSRAATSTFQGPISVGTSSLPFGNAKLVSDGPAVFTGDPTGLGTGAIAITCDFACGNISFYKNNSDEAGGQANSQAWIRDQVGHSGGGEFQFGSAGQIAFAPCQDANQFHCTIQVGTAGSNDTAHLEWSRYVNNTNGQTQLSDVNPYGYGGMLAWQVGYLNNGTISPWGGAEPGFYSQLISTTTNGTRGIVDLVESCDTPATDVGITPNQECGRFNLRGFTAPSLLTSSTSESSLFSGGLTVTGTTTLSYATSTQLTVTGATGLGTSAKLVTVGTTSPPTQGVPNATRLFISSPGCTYNTISSYPVQIQASDAGNPSSVNNGLYFCMDDNTATVKGEAQIQGYRTDGVYSITNINPNAGGVGINTFMNSADLTDSVVIGGNVNQNQWTAMVNPNSGTGIDTNTGIVFSWSTNGNANQRKAALWFQATDPIISNRGQLRGGVDRNSNGSNINASQSVLDADTVFVADYNNGNFGIGTTSPTQSAKLSVTSFSTDTNTNIFQVDRGASGATTTPFAVNMNGNVNVGTSTTAAILNIGADASSASTTIKMHRIQFDGYNSTGARICVEFVGTSLVASTGACTL